MNLDWVKRRIAGRLEQWNTRCAIGTKDAADFVRELDLEDLLKPVAAPPRIYLCRDRKSGQLGYGVHLQDEALQYRHRVFWEGGSCSSLKQFEEDGPFEIIGWFPPVGTE